MENGQAVMSIRKLNVPPPTFQIRPEDWEYIIKMAITFSSGNMLLPAVIEPAAGMMWSVLGGWYSRSTTACFMGK